MGELTEREVQLLQFLADGLTREEIAGKLVLSLNTIRTHLNNSFPKLDAHNELQAVLAAARRGLIRLDGTRDRTLESSPPPPFCPHCGEPLRVGKRYPAGPSR